MPTDPENHKVGVAHNRAMIEGFDACYNAIRVYVARVKASAAADNEWPRLPDVLAGLGATIDKARQQLAQQRRDPKGRWK